MDSLKGLVKPAAAASAVAAEIASQNASTPANSSSWALLPSAKDLLMVVPRAASRAAGLLTDSYDIIESLFNGEFGEQSVAVATAGAGNAGMVGAGAGTGAAATLNAASGGAMSYLRAFNLQQLRTFGGIFTYITSKWAMCCFIVAIILNRTSVYAATRRHLRLRWPVRFFLRSIPIVLLLMQIVSVLRGIRCQTSPDFSKMRYGVENKLVNLDFSQDGGFLHQLSSSLLIGEDELASCQAVDMVPQSVTANSTTRPRGSLSLLWPAFQVLCFSKFTEVFSTTIQGLPSATETGMSLFEHSLAYAETESMIANLIGLGPLSAPSPSSNATASLTEAILGSNATETVSYANRHYVMTKFNTSPEVLLITLISLCNSVSSHLLGIFGKQAQFRLLSTGVWGICFLGCFVWAFNTFSMEKMLDSGIFRFPTVCVVGFFPHLLIVAGIVLCTLIYLLALAMSVISPPPGTGPYNRWIDRLRPMYQNMQANLQLANVRVNMREDFYTALLRLGLSTLTAASEAVFLNEGRHINLGSMTWIEEERMAQVSRAREKGVQLGSAFVSDAADEVASGVQFSDPTPQGLVAPRKWQSGYSRERTTKILKTNGSLRGANDGVGTLQRHNRYALALDFIAKICRLVMGWHLLVLNAILDTARIRYRPDWMRRLLEGPKPQRKPSEAAKSSHSLDFWMLSDSGQMKLPKDRNVDVEGEIRSRIRRSNPNLSAADQERDLDDRLYGWFTSNGWWGEHDSSGDYVPPTQEDDTTSMISFATNATDSDAWESDRDDYDNDGERDSGGRRTPTQQRYSSFSREGTPGPDREALNSSDLIRLLDPQDLESRMEARILARHLADDGIVTRSRFAQICTNPGTSLLTSNRHSRPPGFTPSDPSGKLNAQEEAEILEFLIIKVRKEKAASASSKTPQVSGGSAGAADSDDAADAFSGGPQCVVCQTSPRTIMAWPCRCLSLCEECRISLAMNNFGNCVCCRQEVVGFSRLFVP